MKQRIKQIGITIVLAVLLLTGCWDAKEIDQLYYVNTVGVDYVEGKIVIYLQLMNFASSQPGREGPTVFEIVKGEGNSFVEAAHNLYPSLQRRVYWGQISTIVYSKAALRQGSRQSINEFRRFYEIRNKMWVFATDEPLEQVLAIPPHLGTNILFSYFGDPEESYYQSARVAPMRMYRFISDTTESGKTTIIPTVNIDRLHWLSDGSSVPALRIDGIATLYGNEFKGFLLGKDIEGIRWIQEQTVRTDVHLKERGRPIATLIMTNPKVNVDTVIKNGKVTFNVNIRVSGSIIEKQRKDVSPSNIAKRVEQIVKADIEHTYRKGVDHGADLLQLSYALYRKDPALWRRKTDNGQSIISHDALKSINVSVDIQDSGEEKVRSPR